MFRFNLRAAVSRLFAAATTRRSKRRFGAALPESLEQRVFLSAVAATAADVQVTNESSSSEQYSHNGSSNSSSSTVTSTDAFGTVTVETASSYGGNDYYTVTSTNESSYAAPNWSTSSFETSMTTDDYTYSGSSDSTHESTSFGTMFFDSASQYEDSSLTITDSFSTGRNSFNGDFSTWTMSTFSEVEFNESGSDSVDRTEFGPGDYIETYTWETDVSSNDFHSQFSTDYWESADGSETFSSTFSSTDSSYDGFTVNGRNYTDVFPAAGYEVYTTDTTVVSTDGFHSSDRYNSTHIDSAFVTESGWSESAWGDSSSSETTHNFTRIDANGVTERNNTTSSSWSNGGSSSSSYHVVTPIPNVEVHSLSSHVVPIDAGELSHLQTYFVNVSNGTAGLEHMQFEVEGNVPSELGIHVNGQLVGYATECGFQTYCLSTGGMELAQGVHSIDVYATGKSVGDVFTLTFNPQHDMELSVSGTRRSYVALPNANAPSSTHYAATYVVTAPYTPVCGNGILDPGEQIDHPAFPTCQFSAFAGGGSKIAVASSAPRLTVAGRLVPPAPPAPLSSSVAAPEPVEAFDETKMVAIPAPSQPAPPTVVDDFFLTLSDEMLLELDPFATT